jgi:hypothetical protein
MNQSEFTYDYPLDKRREIEYSIGVRHDPSMNNVESFAAVLFFNLRDGTCVEVAKVDNSQHDGEADIHIDRYYREVGANIKQFDPDIEGWEDAEAYLIDNWKELADRYYENHGGEPRADGANI